MIRFLLLAVLVAAASLAALFSCDREPNDALDWMNAECLECSTLGEQQMCYDGLDNDEDGLTDCDDSDCEGIACCGKVGAENTDEACSDGCDNDGNGYTDCNDFSCTKWTPAVKACKAETEEPEDTPEACSDGIDNDWDGYFDCNDKSCYQSVSVVFCEGNDLTCADGNDNDGDGYTDCKDYSCSKNSAVSVCN